MESFNERIEKLRNLIETSDHIIIGAGAGLSTAAGIEYGGERFKKHFADFIKKYDFTDMYTSGFYPFKSEEEKWAYWARHISVNNVDMPATALYGKLLGLVEDKDYFVITTNVDDQFFKTGFDPDRVFATQGTYAKIQCANACHDTLYDDADFVHECLEKTDDDLKIPSDLVPVCPVCGREMVPYLRSDDKFIEDEEWHVHSGAYHNFVLDAKYDKTLLLEFGVGFNTPIIIRLPFDAYNMNFKNWNLARFNRSHLEYSVNIDGRYHLYPLEASSRIPDGIMDSYLPFDEDIECIIDKLLE